MIVTAAELADNSRSILDQVVEHGETVEIQKLGKTVAVIQRNAGASRAELLEVLRDRSFTPDETRELKAAMDAAADVVGYAGRD